MKNVLIYHPNVFKKYEWGKRQTWGKNSQADLTFSLSPPIPYFSDIPKVRKFLLNLSYAQSLRAIIVGCIGRSSAKYIVAAVEALRKKERQDETQFTTKIGGKNTLDPSYFVL